MTVETNANDDVICPFCGSTETRLEQRKGTAICRSMHYCESCNEPFEELH